MKINLGLVILLTFGFQNYSYSLAVAPSGVFVEVGKNGAATQLTGISNVSVGDKLLAKAKTAGTWIAPVYYALSAAAMAQSLLNFKSTGKSSSAAAHVDNFGNGINSNLNNPGGTNGSENGQNGDLSSFTIDNPPTDAEFLASLSPEIRETFGDDIVNPYKLAKELKDKGYEFDEATGGVKTPDGFVSASELNANAKKLAGDKDMQAFRKSLDQKTKKLLRVMRLKGGANGGYAGRGSGAAPAQATNNNAYSAYGIDSSREPSSVDTDAVEYINGEPVPPKGSNVFHVVKEAYQVLLVDKVLKNNAK